MTNSAIAKAIVNTEKSTAPKSRTRRFSDLMRIKSQMIGRLVFAVSETEGKRKLTSINKAYDEICQNKTIKFDGHVLTFVSRFSGKLRHVTEFGCHESCDCQNIDSYHQAMFEMVSKYYSHPQPGEVRKFVDYDRNGKQVFVSKMWTEQGWFRV